MVKSAFSFTTCPFEAEHRSTLPPVASESKAMKSGSVFHMVCPEELKHKVSSWAQSAASNTTPGDGVPPACT
eukprot:scaffold127_cov230-Pinguiococcus_pyrenoidosus.AAC.1